MTRKKQRKWARRRAAYLRGTMKIAKLIPWGSFDNLLAAAIGERLKAWDALILCKWQYRSPE